MSTTIFPTAVLVPLSAPKGKEAQHSIKGVYLASSSEQQQQQSFPARSTCEISMCPFVVEMVYKRRKNPVCNCKCSLPTHAASNSITIT